ncbi:MAG: Uma2 family endonuclease [Gammaproteobacteria bacterium]|nr:Uma2 family endonuclease [Gammaproteobacteria bacterium]
MFIYYVGRDDNGGPTLASVSPDIFVVYGVPDRPDRNSYVLWNEPDADIRFVLEIASPSTRRRDHTVKREVYASLGVAEYFLYDPPTRRRDARSLGLRLHAGEYEDMPYEELPNGCSGVRSDSTGLVAYVDVEGQLKWFDPVSGRDLQSYEEVQNQANETANQLDAAQAQIAELEARIRRLSGKV